MARFCVTCGGRLRRAREDGRVRRRCPACGWTFYGNPVPAVVGVVARRGTVLLTRRGRPPFAGAWDLPGGFLEAGEAPEAALRRELHEELGMTVRRARLIGFATDRYGTKGFPVLTILYRVAPAPGALTPSDDVTEARWFPATALPLRAIPFPSMRRTLRRYLAASAVRGTSRRARARSS